MKRRDFLQLASKAGLSIPAWGVMSAANAQTAPSFKKITCIWNGGCSDTNAFTVNVRNGMNFWTPAGRNPVTRGRLMAANVADMGAFLTEFGDRMLICIHNVQSNDHDAGRQGSVTGALTGAPNGNAVFAYNKPAVPLRFLLLSGNAYGAVPGVTPAQIADANQFRTSANPLAANATTDLIKKEDITLVQQTQAARAQAKMASATALAHDKRFSDQIMSANGARARLEQAAASLPANLGPRPEVTLAVAALQANISSAVQMQVGGFDTHGNCLVGLEGQNGQGGALRNGLAQLRLLLNQLQTAGIANDTIIEVATDFGRTANNNGQGNDHDGRGCQRILIGPPGWNMGNRIIGARGPALESVRINPISGQPDNVNGIMITSRHVSDAIYTYLGLQMPPGMSLGVPANEKLTALFNPQAHTGYPFSGIPGV